MKKSRDWEFSIGFYTGLVIGVRTYKQQGRVDHVIYLPFMVDICITIYYN